MKKILIIGLFLISSVIYSEDKINYSISTDIASTYILRGYDMYANRLDTVNSKNSIFNFAPAIMPSATVTMNGNLIFNILAIRSLAYREVSAGKLKDYDEIDFTVGYTATNKFGTFSTSLLVYAFPSGSISNYSELTFSYMLPFTILNPTVASFIYIGSDQLSSTEYSTVSISHEFIFDKIKVTPKLLFGYWFQNVDITKNKLHQEFTIPVYYLFTDKSEIHISFIEEFRLFGYDESYNLTSTVVSIGSSYNF